MNCCLTEKSGHQDFSPLENIAVCDPVLPDHKNASRAGHVEKDESLSPAEST